MNTDSILESVKKALGITYDYNYFDSQLIMHINSVFLILQQLGVGPRNGYQITSEADVWSDFLGSSESGRPLNLVQSYMYLRVRLLFDPPTNSFLVESMKQQIQEFEWRLNVAVDPAT